MTDPPATPVKVFIGWLWQSVRVMQWCRISVQVNAEAGSVPCCGSLACPEKAIVSPTAQVSEPDGESMTAVGAALPAEMVTVAVSVALYGSVTVSLAVYVPTAAYVWLTVAVVALAVPTPKSQEYRSCPWSATSGSVEPVP